MPVAAGGASVPAPQLWCGSGAPSGRFRRTWSPRSRRRPRARRSTSTSIRSTTSRRSASTPTSAWCSMIRSRCGATPRPRPSASTCWSRSTSPTPTAASSGERPRPARRAIPPSLRGLWFQSNFLRHGLAHTIREAILAPGHRALEGGERGFAVDALMPCGRCTAATDAAPAWARELLDRRPAWRARHSPPRCFRDPRHRVRCR
jgi:hypothetical protein